MSVWLYSMGTGDSDMAFTWQHLVPALDKRLMSSIAVISSWLGPVPALFQAGADSRSPWGTPGRAGTQAPQAGIRMLALVPTCPLECCFPSLSSKAG